MIVRDSAPKNEDHLIVLIEFFLDFTGGIILFGYDLRIDAYTFCVFKGKNLNWKTFKNGHIYNIKKMVTQKKNLKIIKAEKDFLNDDLYNVTYQCLELSVRELNTIESIYYVNFSNKHEINIELNEYNSSKCISLFIGKISERIEISSLLGPSLDLKVNTAEYPESVTIRTQDFSFQVTDKILFAAVENQFSLGKMLHIIGFKPKDEVEKYLDSDFLIKKNKELKLIEFL